MRNLLPPKFYQTDRRVSKIIQTVRVNFDARKIIDAYKKEQLIEAIKSFTKTDVSGYKKNNLTDMIEKKIKKEMEKFQTYTIKELLAFITNLGLEILPKANEYELKVVIHDYLIRSLIDGSAKIDSETEDKSENDEVKDEPKVVTKLKGSITQKLRLANLQQPEKFWVNGSNPQKDFIAWVRDFLRWMKLTGNDEYEESEKLTCFRYLVGEKADKILTNIKDNVETVEEAIAIIKTQLYPTESKASLRMRFFSRRFKPSEKLDEYLMALRELYNESGLSELKDELLLRDVFIANLPEGTIKEQLIKNPEASLEASVKKVETQGPLFTKNPTFSKIVNKRFKPVSQNGDRSGPCHRCGG